MSLIKQWEEIAYKERTQEEYDKFWKEYLLKEQHIYEELLSNNNNKISGKFAELAEEYHMTSIDFAGFISGINTSLETPLVEEELTEDSKIDITIDFEKLYYNMHEAEAEWLYNLPQWEPILSKEKRKEIKTAYNRTKTVVKEDKTGRNDPCPCGSGKKYKKCCGK
ncbi:hypothetical protein OXPF_41510 [Oxobacter pfennigii]|uniref:Preprotein translocase subunit SecA n=1 Tax=Oxobacter pfennigii TaxID=36849 RepID=A0A0P8WJN2_9CLOT|nr:SEC-C metal-binding domain-containing protein [Oxobacter pfennigii]KPU42366.1 hypothetical protein OXPF_41510 [Oxobacter pfennigii]